MAATPSTQESLCAGESGITRKMQDIAGGVWEGVFTSESASGLVRTGSCRAQHDHVRLPSPILRLLVPPALLSRCCRRMCARGGPCYRARSRSLWSRFSEFCFSAWHGSLVEFRQVLLQLLERVE